MLSQFILAHRDAILALTRARVAERKAPMATERELVTGVPAILDQLVEALGPGSSNRRDPLTRGAALHGAALLERGSTVAQVVHDYGDICQAITKLAAELDAPIPSEDLRALNVCLDEAIAEALTEYTRLRDRAQAAGQTQRAGVLAHELRNRISAAQLGFSAIRSGRAPFAGSVASVVTRNLLGMTALIDRALVDVRLEAGNTLAERVHLFEIIDDARAQGRMEADVRALSLNVGPTDRNIDVDADPQVLAGAVANLLQNAFKFTRPGGTISLKTSAGSGRVLIEVEDECGGLPPGKAEELFDAFRQRGADRSGLGLGLFISRKGVEASGGVLRVRDMPGRGCVFGIDLPMA